MKCKGKIRDFFLILTAAFVLATCMQFIHVVHVEGESMYPTLNSNTFTIGVRAFSIERGDIVISKHDSLGYIIKRVIAVGGDHLRVIGDSIFINGEPVVNSFGVTGDFELDIPYGQVFLMGDNRGNSTDSRMFGPVSIDTIDFKLFTTKTVDAWVYSVLRVIEIIAIVLFIFEDGISSMKERSKRKWEEQVEVEAVVEGRLEEVDRPAEHLADTE